MKTAAEKSTTVSRSQQSEGAFFAGSKSGGFFAPAVQAKLKVGQPGDKFEQEADSMAEKTVQRKAMPGTLDKCGACEEQEQLQRKPLASEITPFVQRKEMSGEEVQKMEEEEVQMKEEGPLQEKSVQRKEEEVQKMGDEEEETVQMMPVQRKEEEVQKLEGEKAEEGPLQEKPVQRKEEEVQKMGDEEEETVQMKRATDMPRPSLGSVKKMLGNSKGQGSKLPDAVRQEMEAGYGVDLGEVRVHTDEASVKMNQGLSAQAFTNGWDVYFNSFKFNPNTDDGKFLLAHELTHTIQQAKANGKPLNPAKLKGRGPVKIGGATVPDVVSRTATGKMPEIAKQPSTDIGAVAVPTPAAAKGKAALIDQKAPKAKEICPPEADRKAPPVATEGVKTAEPAVAKQAPKCPAADPAFAEAKTQIKKDAKKQRSHEPAEQKQAEMVASATMTSAEQNIQSGQEQQAGALEEAAKPRQPFDRAVFKDKLKAQIESKMPETEGEANDFAGSGKLEQAKEEFKGTVGEEKSKVSGPLEQTTAAPLPEGQNLKPDNVEVPAATPAANPSTVPSGLAVPKPRTEEEISLQHRSDELDNQMAQEGLNEKQLEEWEETEEPKALTAKRDAQQEIAAAPGRYQQIEQEDLTAAGAQADGKTATKLKRMAATKNSKNQQVHAGQKTKESQAEQRQREIKLEIDRIFTSTETDVNKILEALATNVQETFALKVEQANQTFKDKVRSRLDDHYGWFTFDDKIAEWAGLSDGVKHIFLEEKERFLTTMDTALEGIATTVETELNSALARIQQGRTELGNFKKTLSTDELKFAEDMLAEANEKFSDLESSVNDSQDELIETLSDQYVDSVNKLQEEFDSINDELSASWIADALSFIGEVATAIKKLGELLSSIAARIGQYIGQILDSPKRFFNNLVDGIKGGMDDFSDNIDTYMEQGFWMWLTGASSSSKIEIPKTMNVEGMFSLAAQILGITKDFIFKRIKAVLKIDVNAFLALIEKADSVATKVMEPVKILLTQGIGALWTWVKDEISSKLEEIFGGLKEDIFQAIIKKFLLWVAGLFVPGLGFIKLIQAAYKALRWLVDNIDRIVEIVNSFLDAIGLAVQGNISGIKQRVVKALKNGVVIAIDFLAKLVGLGNFGDKLQRGIKKLQKPIHGAIDFVLKKARPVVKKIQRAIAKGVKAVVGKGKEAVRSATGVPKDPKERLKIGMEKAVKAVSKLSGSKIGKNLITPALAGVKAMYGFEYLNPVVKDGKWWVRGKVNPGPVEKVTPKKAGATIEISKVLSILSLDREKFKTEILPPEAQKGFVYILKDADTSEILKIGKTELSKYVGRFEKYILAGERVGRKLLVEVFTVDKNKERSLQAIEGQMREGLIKMGEKMPWDNTSQRLNRPGPGVPGTRLNKKLRAKYEWDLKSESLVLTQKTVTTVPAGSTSD